MRTLPSFWLNVEKKSRNITVRFSKKIKHFFARVEFSFHSTAQNVWLAAQKFLNFQNILKNFAKVPLDS